MKVTWFTSNVAFAHIHTIKQINNQKCKSCPVVSMVYNLLNFLGIWFPEDSPRQILYHAMHTGPSQIASLTWKSHRIPLNRTNLQFYNITIFNEIIVHIPWKKTIQILWRIFNVVTKYVLQVQTLKTAF